MAGTTGAHLTQGKIGKSQLECCRASFGTGPIVTDLYDRLKAVMEIRGESFVNQGAQGSFDYAQDDTLGNSAGNPRFEAPPRLKELPQARTRYHFPNASLFTTYGIFVTSPP